MFISIITTKIYKVKKLSYYNPYPYISHIHTPPIASRYLNETNRFNFDLKKTTEEKQTR